MVDGKWKTPLMIRQEAYESIITEVVNIARMSEGSIQPDWVMTQPIFIRKSLYKQLKEERDKMVRQQNSVSNK